MILYICLAVLVVLALACVYRNKKAKAGKEEDEMPVGLQVRDEEGSILYDFSSETFHVFGTGTITGGVSGSITDSRIRQNDTILLPLVQTLHDFNVNDYNTTQTQGSYQYQQKVYAVYPDITIANGVISWSFRQPADPRGHYVDVDFVYGGRLF